jgi:hypothetical protein
MVLANILIANAQTHTRLNLINFTDVDIPFKPGSYLSYADVVLCVATKVIKPLIRVYALLEKVSRA